MNIEAASEPSFDPGVSEFLTGHAAEGEFQIVCELVRSCFPELEGIRASLQQDADEEDRWRVIVGITLSPSHPLDLLQNERRCFAEQVVHRLPPERFPNPICGLMISYARE